MALRRCSSAKVTIYKTSDAGTLQVISPWGSCMINLLVAASVAFAAAPMAQAPTLNEIDLGPTQR
jgi:hypothetical protein